MKITTTSTITCDCPICGRTISILAGHEVPEAIVFIKTKRRTVVLAHAMCVVQNQKGE